MVLTLVLYCVLRKGRKQVRSSPVGPPPRACPIFAFPLMAKFSPKVPLHFSCCTFVFRPPILSNQKRNDDNPLIQQSIVLLRYLCTAQQCTHDTGTHTHAQEDLENTFRYRTKLNRCWLNSTYDIWVIIAISCFRLFVLSLLSLILWWKHRCYRWAGELLRK